MCSYFVSAPAVTVVAQPSPAYAAAVQAEQEKRTAFLVWAFFLSRVVFFRVFLACVCCVFLLYLTLLFN